MEPKLRELIERFKREQNYRDTGAAARKTYAEIKAIANPHDLIKFLEEILHLN